MASLDCYCNHGYGFMLCTTTVLGNIFLVLVYGYLMLFAGKFLNEGSEFFYLCSAHFLMLLSALVCIHSISQPLFEFAISKNIIYSFPAPLLYSSSEIYDSGEISLLILISISSPTFFSSCRLSGPYIWLKFPRFPKNISANFNLFFTHSKCMTK